MKAINLERSIQTILIGMLFVQVVFLGVLLWRVNTVERSVVKLYEALAAPGEPELAETIANISIDDRPYRGKQDAPITIVEFSDFSCPYCQQVQPILDVLLEKYDGEVKLVYRYFPLNPNVDSEVFRAAVAAECAHQQDAFWEMHDLLFANPGSWGEEDLLVYASGIELDNQEFMSCLTSPDATEIVKNDLNDAYTLGVTGTPTFFINGRMLAGGQTLPIFEFAIEEVTKIISENSES